MKRKMVLLLIIGMCFAILLLLETASIQAQTGGTYELTWSTLDGGGGASTGGTYSLDGTIGQPDAGQMNGGTFSLTGGFWGFAANAVNTINKIFLPLVVK